MTTCEVCGMMFDKRAAAAVSVYLNRKFYFCHGFCKRIFDARPARFYKAKKKFARVVPKPTA